MFASQYITYKLGDNIRSHTNMTILRKNLCIRCPFLQLGGDYNILINLTKVQEYHTFLQYMYCEFLCLLSDPHSV